MAITAKTGLVQNAYWIDATPANQPIGLIDGGQWEEQANVETVRGIGGTFAKYGGLYLPSIQVSGKATTDTKTLIDTYGLRSSYPGGLPTAFPTGVQAGDDARSLKLTTNARIDEWKVSCEAGAAAEFDVTIRALDADPTAGAIGSVTLGSTAPFVWGAGSITVDAATKNCRKIEVSVNNNIDRKADLDAAATNAKRLASVEIPGWEEVKVTLETYTNLGIDLSEDALDLDVDIVWVLSDGATSWTFTLSGLSFESARSSLTADGEAVYEYSLVGEDSQSTTLVLS